MNKAAHQVIFKQWSLSTRQKHAYTINRDKEVVRMRRKLFQQKRKKTHTAFAASVLCRLDEMSMNSIGF